MILTSTTTWVLVAIVVIAILTLVAASLWSRSRRLAARRDEAVRHREQARVVEQHAEEARLEAQERAARAERERVAADNLAQQAEAQNAAAREHARRADEIDPDADVEEPAQADGFDDRSAADTGRP